MGSTRQLHAAFGQQVITPEPGCYLTGFIARTEPSTDVHDDLLARLLLIEYDDNRLALITADMLGTDIETATHLRAKVAAVLGTPTDNVMLNATHTHAGPASADLIGIAPLDRAFMDRLERALCELARNAATELEPAVLAYRRGRAPGVGMIRRWPGQSPAPYPLDDTLEVISIERPTGPPIGMVVSLPCHAVAAGTTLSISADFPGEMVRSLATDHPDQVIAFAQGCCGDINPAAGVRGHQAANEAGTNLADAVRATLRDVAPRTFDGPIIAAATTTVLPLDDPPPRDELLSLDEKSRLPDADAVDVSMGEFARRTLAAIEADAVPAGIEVPLQVFAIGPEPSLRIVGLPGESLSTLAMSLRASLPESTVILGYTNGLMGYLADRRSHADGGYEVDVAFRYYGYPARYAADAGELLVEATRSMVRAQIDESEQTKNGGLR